jgi:hypothetical protein
MKSIKMLILANILEFLINKKKLILILEFSKYLKKHRRFRYKEKRIDIMYVDIDKTLKGLKAQNFCLLRTSLAYLFLCWYGYKCEFVIGVEIDPFASHAWLEIDSIPLHEYNPVYSYEQILKIG